MNAPILILISFIVIIDASFVNIIESLKQSLATRRTPSCTIGLIRKNGYPVESHYVITEDGYVLQMHRIPSRQKGKLPVLLQHGLFGSSADFVLLDPKKSLAFILADLGHDVWLGNLRGNVYSKSHTLYYPNDTKFWDFTWHESGIYDLPAQIDYILKQTNSKKLLYVGHSMGTTAFFVMTSTKPEYNDKISNAFLMGPLAYLKHSDVPFLKNLEKFETGSKNHRSGIIRGKFMPQITFGTQFARDYCLRNNIRVDLCSDVLLLIDEFDVNKYGKEKMGVYLNNYLKGYSLKNLHHYSQLMKSGRFAQFDYGPKENKQRYGSVTPPKYNLTAINTKMHFIVAPHDPLSSMPDSIHIAKKLPTLKRIHVVDVPLYNHLDFILGDQSRNFVYKIIVKRITQPWNLMRSAEKGSCIPF